MYLKYRIICNSPCGYVYERTESRINEHLILIKNIDKEEGIKMWPSGME